ncbi:MAG TPA: metalloregulator ArsR/SmtB family transcription factor [Candidatus Dormibacteraeota bacterium]|nr:metalloregulator ArsR/SmtB family transcription factor [Candidatus Dormibacteraeota bacterium]
MNGHDPLAATDPIGPVADIATVLQAMADPVRLAMVRSLASNDEPICCGSFQVPVTKSTLSHHLRVLREAGLIEQRSEGTRRLTTLRRAEIDAAFPGLVETLVRAPLQLPESLEMQELPGESAVVVSPH